MTTAKKTVRTVVVECGVEAARAMAERQHVALLVVRRGTEEPAELSAEVDWVAYATGGLLCELRPRTLAGQLALSLEVAGARA